jgi:hypothetical protein
LVVERVVAGVEDAARVPLLEVDWDTVAVAAPSAVYMEGVTVHSPSVEPDFVEVGKGAPTSVASRTVAAVKP